MERFQFVMKKIEKRLDAATDVMRSLKTFGRKAMEELNRLHENAEQNRDDPIEENERSFEVESLIYNGVNLLGLGGNTHRERALLIANKIWTPEERKKYCIAPRKMLIGEREPADEERTEVYRSALMGVLKNDFNEVKYRDILRYVNQQGVDMQRKRKSVGNENRNPETDSSQEDA